MRRVPVRVEKPKVNGSQNSCLSTKLITDIFATKKKVSSKVVHSSLHHKIKMGIFKVRKREKTALAEAAVESARASPDRAWQPPPQQYVELGTIRYVNLSADGRHGDYKTAVKVARETGKPIFANFVEWSG